MKKVILAMICFLMIVTPVFAFNFDPVGEYQYKEKGYSGKMVITQIGIEPISWTANIGTVNKNGNDCSIEGAIGYHLMSSDKWVESTFEDKSEGSPITKFIIKFTPKGSVIDVKESGGACRLNVWFGGKWTKVVSKKSDQKK